MQYHELGLKRNSANKLSYMYQITDVLFSDINDSYDVTSDDVVVG